MKAFQARPQPLLALAILVLVIFAGAGFAIMPLWRASEHYDATIASLQKRLEVQRRIAAAGTGLGPQLAQLETRYKSDGRYLKSASQALAGAELQGIVKRTVLARRGEILATQIVGDDLDARSQRVTLGVTMRASLDQIVQIFYALETSDPYLFVDNISIRNRASQRVRTSTTAPVSAPLLDVQFELSGYLRGGAA